MNKIGKKILILILIIVLITGALLGYFFLHSKEKTISNLFRLVPVDASIIIETNTTLEAIPKLQDQNMLWKTLCLSPEFNDINGQITYIDSLFNANISFLPPLNSNIITSFHNIGKDQTGILYIVQMGAVIDPSVITQIIEKETGEPGCVTIRKYEDYEIHQIQTSQESKANNLYFAMIGDAVLITYTPILIEDAIRQYNSGFSIMNDKDFLKVQKTAGDKVDGNIYINFREFPRFISLFLNKKHKRNVSSFINFASWSEFDLHIKSNQLLFNGFIHGNDSIGDFIHCIIGQSPREMEFSVISPATTGSFVAFAISDYEQWIKSLGLFYEKEGTYSEFLEPAEQIKKNYKTDIVELTESIFDNEVVLLYNDDQNSNPDDRSFVLVKVKSKSQARSKMLEMMAHSSQGNADSISRFIQSVSIDNEFSDEFFTCPIPYLARAMFGNTFSRSETRFYTFIDNYMVFGNSIASLKDFYYSYLLKKNLASEKSFQTLCEGLNKNSSIIVYIDPQRSTDFLSWYADEPIMKHLAQNKDNYKNLNNITLQLVSSKNMLYTNLIFSYSSEIREKAKTVWESRLDTTFSSKPWILNNHNNDEKEILLQDDKNQLYQISSSGRILWKISLPEKIISDIQQIDAFKNSKLQYIFNTKNYLIMVDRNGNYMDRFPLKLRAEATNGMAIFDYDESRDYRIFLACNDHKVYCYKPDGSLVSGWEFGNTDKEVRQPIQHFRFGDKDYIIFCDTLKTYIVDRKGKTKISVKEFIPTNDQARFFADRTEAKKEKFMITNVNGKLYKIGQDGKVTKETYGEFSTSHIFDYTDINGDGKSDYCFLDKDNFSVYDASKKKVFTYTFDQEISGKPAFYVFPNNQRRTGFVGDGKIFLIDAKGSLHPGFPLNGTTPFSIGKLTKEANIFNLLTGGNEGILLNYEVLY